MDISNLTLHVSIGGDGYPFYSSNYGWIGEWMVICCEKYKSQSRKQPYLFLNYSYRKKTKTKTQKFFDSLYLFSFLVFIIFRQLYNIFYRNKNKDDTQHHLYDIEIYFEGGGYTKY